MLRWWTSIAALTFGCQLGPDPCDVRAVKERHESELMRLEGVVGAAIGECDGEECIRVFVREGTPDGPRSVPKELEGCRVDVELTEDIEIDAPPPTPPK